MKAEEIEENFGVCGLVCTLCSYSTTCAGCLSKTGACQMKDCCLAKGLSFCFLCEEWPCGKDTQMGIRRRAFNQVARSEGLHQLALYLASNVEQGIVYHRPGGLTGDYDRCKTEQDVITLLKYGKPDPYDVCPTYESESFLLRLVSLEDTEDLLKCYSNSEAQKYFNADNCTSDFIYSTLDEMKSCIDFWFDNYNDKRFVRFSIFNKLLGKAVGTVEIVGKHGVLRIDILPEYENDACLTELLKIADHFFSDFKCEKLVTKAIPDAKERINSLLQNGYAEYPVNTGWTRDNYYVKPYRDQT